MPAASNWVSGNLFAAGDANNVANVANGFVRCATTGSETYTITSGSVTTINGTTVDGVSVAVGDRILIKDAPSASGTGSFRSSQPANGIYTVTAVATNISVARAGDMAASSGGNGTAQNPSGAAVDVMAGTSNAQSSWQVSSPSSPTGAFTYGTTAVQWALLASAPTLSGTYASMPAASRPGRLYVCTDTGDVYQDSGSAWALSVVGDGAAVTAPPSSSWSTYGTPTGASVAASLGGQLMQWTNQNGSADSCFIQARPLSLTSGYASGWTATFCIDWQFAWVTNTAGFICFGDGTKWVSLTYQVQSGGTGNVIWEHWNSVTSLSSNVVTNGGQYAAGEMAAFRFMRLSYNGSTMTGSISKNGIDFITIYSESYTAFVSAPAYVGWGCNTYGSSTLGNTARLRSLTGVS